MKTKSILAGIVFFLLPCAVHAWTGDTWGNITRATIKSIADQMIDSTWTPASTFTDYEYSGVYHTYYVGVVYQGIAYSQAPVQDAWADFFYEVNTTTGSGTEY